MTNILIDDAISAAIVNDINRAQERVTIVSPYFDPWPKLLKALEGAMKRNLQVTLYFREDWVDKFKKKNKDNHLENCLTHLCTVPRLHAKVYHTDAGTIITSLNALDSSRDKSIEIGIQITDEEDRKELVTFMNTVIRRSATPLNPQELFGESTFLDKALSVFVTKVMPKKKKRGTTVLKGFCIGCKESLRHNTKKPLCRKCYSRSNPKSSMTYCHSCGQKASTSRFHAQCYSCYKSRARG